MAAHDTADPTPHFTLGSETRGEDHWLWVSGELDLATDRDLRAALAAVELKPDGTVWLELGDLDFADAASTHQLVAFVRSTRRSGRRVGVDGAHGVTRRIIDLLGLDGELAVA